MDATAAQTLHRDRHRRPSTPARCGCGPPSVGSSNPADYLVQRHRHHADQRHLHAQPAAGLRLHADHHDRARQGHRDRHRRGRPCRCPTRDNYDSYAVGTEARLPRRHAGRVRDGRPAAAAGPGGACGRCRRGRRSPGTRSPTRTPSSATPTWSNYRVVVGRAAGDRPGTPRCIGRATWQHAFGPAGLDAYYLRVSNTGAWSICRNDVNNVMTSVRSGTVARAGHRTRWHTLALTFSGSAPSPPQIDGTQVATFTDATWSVGQVGFGTSQTETAQFDNLSITAVSRPPPPVDRAAGRGRLQPVPRRAEPEPDQRRAAGDLGLQRRREPAVGPPRRTSCGSTAPSVST